MSIEWQGEWSKPSKPFDWTPYIEYARAGGTWTQEYPGQWLLPSDRWKNAWEGLGKPDLGKPSGDD